MTNPAAGAPGGAAQENDPGMKMLNQLFDQLAYITTDVDQATTLFRDQFGVPDFQVGEQEVDAEENGRPCKIRMKVAQAMMNGGELEIIEDRGSDTDLFRQKLPTDGSFAVKVHHVQFQITGTYDDWLRYIEEMTRSHPPRLLGAVGDDLRFAFVDEMARLGHNLEYVWFSDRQREKMNHVPKVI